MKIIITDLKIFSFLILCSSLVFYNVNKFYLRSLNNLNPIQQLIIDVLPNFLIVIIFFALLTLIQPFAFRHRKKRFFYYPSLIIFCLLLGLEEATGIFEMSKVADIKDSMASYFAATCLIVSYEVKRYYELKKIISKAFTN